jgi:hypothetical protein
MELEARIWFAAPQRRYLRAMKNKTLRSRQNQHSASVNLSKHLAGAIPAFSWAGHLSRADWKKKKR